MKTIIPIVKRVFTFKIHQLDFDSVTKLNIKSLFRFTHFDPYGFYEDILKNTLYFSAKSQLNDPFDSRIPTKYSLCNEKELDMYLENLLVKKGIDGDDKDNKLKIAKERLKNNPQEIQSNIENHIERKVGILALTEDCKNLLLWAHYTNKHTGFCIELDAQLLNKIIIAEFQKNRELAFIFKVKYQNKFPIINPCKHSFEQRTQLQFLIKSKAWKYEQEWRIILLNGSKQKRVLPPEVFKRIYFGLKTHRDNIQKSKELLRQYNPKIELYQAIKKKDAFGLEFNKLS